MLLQNWILLTVLTICIAFPVSRHNLHGTVYFGLVILYTLVDAICDAIRSSKL